MSSFDGSKSFNSILLKFFNGRAQKPSLKQKDFKKSRRKHAELKPTKSIKMEHPERLATEELKN